MSSPRLLLDTNIIIDLLRGRQNALNYFVAISEKTELLVSSITVTELFAGIKSNDEEESINLYLKNSLIIPVDYTLARHGGLLKKEYGPSHGIGIADAVIAATALNESARLITLNLKHFPMVDLKEAPY